MKKLGVARPSMLSSGSKLLSAGLIGSLLTALLGCAGCGEGPNYLGPMVYLIGSFNNWSKSDQAAALTWDGSVYRGEAGLPGDELYLQIYAPYTGGLYGISGTSRAIPGTFSVVGPQAATTVNTPLPTQYQLEFDSVSNAVRIDLADDAASGLSAGSAPDPVGALITALRGSDLISSSQQAARASALKQVLSDPAVELPLRVGSGAQRGVTFISMQDPGGLPEMSVVGDFNEWTDGDDPMSFVLDGTVAYLGRVASGVRLEYRFSLHGQRTADPKNYEIIWDGAYLPPNLDNILGGNVGDFNSVAMTLGYVETSSRLHLLSLPFTSKGQTSQRDVYVYLPPGYDLPQNAGVIYPSLYIHDGKDAIVRGHYNQSLDQLIGGKQIPPLIAVFIPAQSDPIQRLDEYASFADANFPDVTPASSDFENFVVNVVVPGVGSRFPVARTSDKRAMLGVDMAGPLTMHMLWNNTNPAFLRVASQSGRLGWGLPSYATLMKSAPAGSLPLKISFDWADGDNFQVAANEQLMTQLYTKIAPAAVNFNKQASPPAAASPWDTWRTRLDASLTFLLQDLVGQ